MEVDFPPQCGWASTYPLRSWIEQNVKEVRLIPLLPSCLNWGIGFLLSLDWYAISSPSSQAFGLQEEVYHRLFWISSLQIADYGTQPLQLHGLILYNKFPYIYIYTHTHICIHIYSVCIYPIDSVSEPWSIHLYTLSELKWDTPTEGKLPSSWFQTRLWVNEVLFRSMCCAMLCLVSVVFKSLWPHDCSLPGSSVHGDSPGKNTGGLPCPPPRDRKCNFCCCFFFCCCLFV